MHVEAIKLVIRVKLIYLMTGLCLSIYILSDIRVKEKNSTVFAFHRVKAMIQSVQAQSEKVMSVCNDH